MPTNGGRPKESPPEGYVSIRGAAEMLGVSETAVRGRIQRGTLPAEEHMLENRETRRYIPRAAIEEAAAQRQEVALRQDIETHQARADRLVEELKVQIQENRRVSQEIGASVTEHFDAMLEIMARLETGLEEAARARREATETEKRYQDRVLELMEQVERKEQRGFWARLFGG